MKNTEKELELEWWTVENDKIVLTPKAPLWLVKEMDNYHRIYAEFEEEIKEYICYDGPWPNVEHPVISRLNDEELDLLGEMLFGDYYININQCHMYGSVD